MDAKTSVIMPSMWRPLQLRRCLVQLLSTIPQNAEVIVVIDEDPESVLQVANLAETDPRLRVISRTKRGGAISAWNLGLKAATGDILVLGADDLWFTDGWYSAMMDGFHRGAFVGLTYWDGWNGHWATHYAMTRAYLIRHNGGVLACPAYHACWTDPEATARAVRAGEYVEAPAVIEHRHPHFGFGDWDETYELAGKKWHHEDEAIFRARQAAGWLDDYEPVLRVICPG